MTALTDYSENLSLNWLLTNGAATRPTAWFVGLGTGGSDTGLVGEPSGNGYARQAVTFAAASGGATSNTALLTFGPCTGSGWGTMANICIFDASTAGNPLLQGTLSASVLVAVADSITFAIGDLDATAA